jgi:hypothetical protein
MGRWHQYRLIDAFVVTAAVAFACAGASSFGPMRLPVVLAVVLSLLMPWFVRRDPFLALLVAPAGGALGGFLGAGLLLMLGYTPHGPARQPPVSSSELVLFHAFQGFGVGFAMSVAVVLLIGVVRLIRHL